MSIRHREETVNTQLAVLLSSLGVEAEAESILSHGKARPDVLFILRGLRVAIEGKFADHPSVKDVVFDGQIGLAVPQHDLPVLSSSLREGEGIVGDQYVVEAVRGLNRPAVGNVVEQVVGDGEI